MQTLFVIGLQSCIGNGQHTDRLGANHQWSPHPTLPISTRVLFPPIRIARGIAHNQRLLSLEDLLRWRVPGQRELAADTMSIRAGGLGDYQGFAVAQVEDRPAEAHHAVQLLENGANNRFLVEAARKGRHHLAQALGYQPMLLLLGKQSGSLNRGCYRTADRLYKLDLSRAE